MIDASEIKADVAGPENETPENTIIIEKEAIRGFEVRDTKNMKREHRKKPNSIGYFLPNLSAIEPAGKVITAARSLANVITRPLMRTSIERISWR
jgi:hypothetical protein